MVNTPPLSPAGVGLLWDSCSPMPGRTAGGRRDCAHVTGHMLVMGSVLALVWVLGSVQGWWPLLCVEVCVTTCFHMAGESQPSEWQPCLLHAFPGWGFLLLCPGPPPLITTGVLSIPFEGRGEQGGVQVSWAHHI